MGKMIALVAGVVLWAVLGVPRGARAVPIECVLCPHECLSYDCDECDDCDDCDECDECPDCECPSLGDIEAVCENACHGSCENACQGTCENACEGSCEQVCGSANQTCEEASDTCEGASQVCEGAANQCGDASLVCEDAADTFTCIVEIPSPDKICVDPTREEGIAALLNHYEEGNWRCRVVDRPSRFKMQCRKRKP